MKYIIIAIIACVLGYFYGYMEGYVKGYDDAKETYSSFYERLMKIQKETYEKIER